MIINLHFYTSLLVKYRQKKHRQTKLHDLQIPIYRKVPGTWEYKTTNNNITCICKKGNC